MKMAKKNLYGPESQKCVNTRAFTLLSLVCAILITTSSNIAVAQIYYVADTKGADGILGTGDDVDSNDSYPGTIAQPWRTLAKAGATAQAGDTVLVKAGTYTGTGDSTIPVANSGNAVDGYITFKAYPGDECQGGYGEPKSNCKVVLDGAGSIKWAAKIYPHNYIRIEGFEITNYTWSDIIHIAGTNQNNDHIQIVNNYIHDAGGDAVHLGYAGGTVNYVLIENNEIAEVASNFDYANAVIFGTGQYVTVRGNYIHECFQDALDVGGSNWLVEYNVIADVHFEGEHEDGINFLSCSGVVIRYNTVSDYTQLIYFPLKDNPSRQAVNVQIYGNILYNDKAWTEEKRTPPGIFIDARQDLNTINNIDIHSNTIGWLGVAGVQILTNGPTSVSDVDIRNNILLSSMNLSANVIDATDSDYNLYYGVGKPDYDGDGSFVADPYFVDYTGQGSESFDFHLQPTSPAIDNGSDLLLFVLPIPFLDIDSNVKPSNSSFDIGAYEYVSGSVDTSPPSKPQNLNGTAASETQIDLSWDSSSDPESGISYYKIYRDSTQIDTITSTTYSDTGLSSGTSYPYQVSAVNGAGLESARSNVAQAKTLSDDTPPTIESITVNSLVNILFSESLDQTSAETTLNYSISPGITINLATLQEDLRTVILETSDHQEGIDYTLTVNGVMDVAGNPTSEEIEIYQYNYGLVGFWEFEEGSGLTTADSSGNGNTGILANEQMWTGQSNMGFNFPGDFVEIPTNGMNASSGTVAMLAYAEGFSQSKHFLFGHATQPWSNRIQLYCDASGNITLGLGDNPSLRTNIQTLNTGEWYHIALTWDGSNYTVFINGTPIVGGVHASLNTFEAYADIGNNGNRSERGEAFNGTIDKVRIYNWALSSTEIQQLYSASIEPINQPPTAGNDSATVDEDSTANVIDVLTNDTDADGDMLSVASFTQVSHGNVVYNANGTFTYTPTADYNGSDSFTYTVSDGNSGTDSAVVGITVNNTPDAPILDAIGDRTVNENQMITIVVNATDADGETITYSVEPRPEGATFDNPFVWTPDYDDAGTYELTFIASDGTLQDSETITIIVNNVNRSPVAVADSAVTDEDNTVITGNVLTNDTDADGHILGVASATQATHGTAVYNNDGTFTYTPAANYNGNDSFTYTVSDGNGGTDTATVQIEVTPINDPPDVSAIPDILQKYEDEAILPKEIELATDVDSGDTLTYTYLPDLQATDYILHVDVSDGTVTVRKDVTITVIPVLPAVISVTATKYSVEILFSEDLERSSAENTGNYSIENYSLSKPIVINTLELNAERDTVTLYTTSHTETEGVPYNLTVANVEDSAGNPMLEDTVEYTYDPGLIGLWNFNTDGGDTAQDSSGYDNMATLVNGPVWTEQGYLNFDGIDDAVELPTNYWNVNSGTVALWAYAEDLAGTHYLFGHTTGSGGDRIQLYTLDQNLNLGLGNSEKLNIVNLDLQAWHHFALTWDGTDYVVYVDGVEKSSGFYTGFNNLNEFADIGNNGDVSFDNAFAGHIDDTRIYNRALTPDEIINVYLMSDESVRENKALAFDVIATYPDGTGLTYEINQLPDGATFKDGTFAWNPWYDQAGTYDITFLPFDEQQPQYSQIVTVVVKDVQLSDWYQKWLEHVGLL